MTGPVPAQLRGLGGTSDRQHFEIQILGQTLVQAQFFAAEVFAGIQAGEIEETEVDRFFHFIDVGAGEQHPGNVSLDDLKPIDGVRVQGRVLQCGDQ